MAAAFRVCRAGLAGGLVATALLAFAAVAGANTYVPNKISDHAPNRCTHHDCTLREAVIKSNNHSGHDSIVLRSRKPYKLHIAPVGPDDVTTGDLDITDPVTLKHRGRGRAIVDANHIDRALHLTTPNSARYTKLSRLVIRGGEATTWGGGILLGNGLLGLTKSVVSGNVAAFDGGGIYASEGELTLVKSRVSGNQAAGGGGGVWSAVETVVRNSTISGNHAAQEGGGFVISSADAVIRGSTVSGNSSDADLPAGGGGIRLTGGSLTMRNDTVANNKVAGDGGGILSNGTADLNNVTVARNLADSNDSGGGPAGGIFANSGTFTIGNSLIALNSIGSTGSAPDCRGTFTSTGHNLVTAITIGCFGFTGAGDFSVPDPKIGPLANNGGPTKTIALKTGSPAIAKAGKATAEKRDQRGVKRDRHPDIGAYER